MSGGLHITTLHHDGTKHYFTCLAGDVTHTDNAYDTADETVAAARLHHRQVDADAEPERRFWLVDVYVYDTRNGFRVGSAYSMPRFFVREASHEKATEAAMLILGPIARKAQKFDMTIEAVDEEES